MVEIEEEKQAQQELNLPPYPEALLEVTPEVFELMRYKGKAEDIPHRVKHKLFLIWITWAQHRNDEKLIEIVNTEMDKKSDTYYLANAIVQMLDQVGRILSLTDITREIFTVSQEEAEIKGCEIRDTDLLTP